MKKSTEKFINVGDQEIILKLQKNTYNLIVVGKMSRRRALSEDDYSDCSKDDGYQEQIDSCSDNEKVADAKDVNSSSIESNVPRKDISNVHAEIVSANYVITPPEEDNKQFAGKDSKTHSVAGRNENRWDPYYTATGKYFSHDNREAKKSTNIQNFRFRNNFDELEKNERYCIDMVN